MVVKSHVLVLKRERQDDLQHEKPAREMMQRAAPDPETREPTKARDIDIDLFTAPSQLVSVLLDICHCRVRTPSVHFVCLRVRLSLYICVNSISNRAILL